VLLARTAATVDRQTGGRLVLGLGTGYMQAEHEAADIDLRPPAERVDRLEESLIALRSLLDHGTAHFDGRHHRLAVDDLGIRPAQRSVPLLVGGHGRRLVTTAAHHADIFQFTGLTHGRGGAPGPGGFAPDAVALRRQWLVEAAGDRLEQMTCSALVQATHVGSGADDAAAAAADRTGLDREALSNTPFVLIGSVDQVVDQVERLRDTLGITHWVVRDPAGFAPVVEALAGR
jgi:probable F420-dependent oxidoreductase